MAKAAGVLAEFYDAWRAQKLDWLASYLPGDFSHTMHFPRALSPLAGKYSGKESVLSRWRLFVEHYEFLNFDTRGLIVDNERAAVEIPFHYRHRQTGVELKTTKANFWMLIDGWPVHLTEYYDVDSVAAHARAIAELGHAWPRGDVGDTR